MEQLLLPLNLVSKERAFEIWNLIMAQRGNYIWARWQHDFMQFVSKKLMGGEWTFSSMIKPNGEWGDIVIDGHYDKMEEYKEEANLIRMTLMRGD